MDYLKEDFATVDAVLFPDPFDSTTESGASVTIRADATGGLFGAEGIAVAWAGAPPTHGPAYGTKILTNVGRPNILTSKQNRPTHMRIAFSLAIPTVTGFTTNDRVKIVSVMCNDATGAEVELCSMLWQKTASAYKWVIKSVGATETVGSTFSPSGFAYSTHQGWVLDIIMKDGVGHINIATNWGWDNQSSAGANVKHSFATGALTGFLRATSISHIPTKVHFGAVTVTDAVDVAKVPSAASEFNFDDLYIVDNLMDNPGFVVPYEGNHQYIRGNAAHGIIPWMDRNPEIGCSLDLDSAQVGLPFQSFCAFGSVGSTNIQLADTGPTTQIAVDENAMYMIACTDVESSMPNTDNPATRADPVALKGSFLGRGYMQIYTQKFNANSTALPSVPYWGMNQIVRNRHYITVPPGHNELVLYNGEFIEMEVYVHRIRFPF